MADTDDARPRPRRPRPPKIDPVVEVLREVLRVQELQLGALEKIYLLLERTPSPGPNPQPEPGPVRHITITPGTPTPK